MNDRCREIKLILSSADGPISASSLASKLNVSRQIIVGDVALLRATGIDIIATSRGYILKDGKDAFPFVGALSCNHSPEELKVELYTIVDYGATVIDVSVEHAIYGELTGRLDLSSRYDVDQFISKVNNNTNSAPISTLTRGEHTHRIGCKDKDTFNRIHAKLIQLGISE